MLLDNLAARTRKVIAGDYFVFRATTRRHIVGRVICTDARVSLLSKEEANCVLIYLFRTELVEPFDASIYNKEDLLVPPALTNRLGWWHGVYKTVLRKDVEPGEVFERHCFRSLVSVRPTFYDERGRRLPGPAKPCGVQALQPFEALAIDCYRVLSGLPSEWESV